MFWKFEPYLYYHFISYCATPQYGGIIPYMNDWRRKNFGPPRGRGGRGVWGKFRRARAFRRSDAEAVSSVQKKFEQSCIIPPISNFPIFSRPIRPREARKGMETLAPPPRRAPPPPGALG